MSKKMLIDASHPEETRVVVVDGTRVEELDFESRNKRQIRGNVYLARVTRVEPSLQAAFVEYGGNRHGFLAFSEIHPDYYQIPYEDRVALLEEEEAEAKADDDDDEELETNAGSDEDEDDAESDNDDDEDDEIEADATDADDAEVAVEQSKTANTRRKRMNRRRYKIQEVIKRGQILLIQAVKEERGNKGAAMTTYLSLAGRYCVFMPNTPRGGGISRKIANGSDRKRLKSIVNGLEVPQGIGVIVRTAGAKKSKAEIERDYEYLSRLWSTIRDTTLKSIAPALIHEEGNLVKRSVRDLYNKDIEEILVQGEDAYDSAKEFIKTLMPTHADKVQHYNDTVPLFLRYEIEKQIEASLKSVVQLASGGYLVIHPTEALVSVDVNSGRSTKERNVERTALKTNLEAAEELARQMRLRDLAGLVVIDFIDMDENRNNRAVEKRMKDVLSNDRARVQMSRISQFGLMEISRQRRRRSLLEGSTASCEHCDGVGRKRTIESSALAAIRAVEEIGARNQSKRIKLKVSPDVALYIFNEKRSLLTKVDDEFNLFTELSGDENLIRPSYTIEVVEKTSGEDDPLEAIERDNKKAEKENRAKRSRRKKSEKEDENSSEDARDENTEDTQEDGDDEESGRKRRRRRGRRGGRNKRKDETQETDSNDNESESEETAEQVSSNKEDAKPRKRRASRKAPSRNKTDKSDNTETHSDADDVSAKDEENGKGKRRRAAPKRKSKSEKSNDVPAEVEAEMTDEKPAQVKPKRKGVRKAPARKSSASEAPEQTDTEDASAKPKTRTSTRKKAPAKSSETSSEDKKPKAAAKTKAPTRTRKAPTKAAEDADTPKPKKRAAPKKATTKKADVDTAEAEAKPARKAAAKKAAPKKAAAKKAPVKKTAPKKAVTEGDEAKAKPAAKRKAPAKPKAAAKKKAPAAKKAPAKKVAADVEDAPKAKKAATRKAPARKAAPKSVPLADSTPTITDTSPVEDEPAKKKGWWKRIIK